MAALKPGLLVSVWQGFSQFYGIFSQLIIDAIGFIPAQEQIPEC